MIFKGTPQHFNEQPPEELYVPSKCHDITEGNEKSFVRIKSELDLNEGPLTYFSGLPYPKKGFPTINTTETINIVKKITLFTFRNWFILSKKNIARYLELVEYVLDNPFKKYLIGHSHWHNEKYWNRFSKEFKKLLGVMFEDLGVDKRLARVFGMIIELDDAYRLRLEDVFNESSQEVLLKEPFTELRRLIKIYVSRDDKNVSIKTKVFFNLLSWSLLIPKFRRAFRKAIKNVEFKNLQYDKIDEYWILNPSGYHHKGFTDMQKYLRYISHHLNGEPPTTKLV